MKLVFAAALSITFIIMSAGMNPGQFFNFFILLQSITLLAVLILLKNLATLCSEEKKLYKWKAYVNLCWVYTWSLVILFLALSCNCIKMYHP